MIIRITSGSRLIPSNFFGEDDRQAGAHRQEAIDLGRGDDQHDGRGIDHRRPAEVPEHLPGEGAIGETEDQRVQCCDPRGFGHCEDTRDNPPDEDQRCQEGRSGLANRAAEARPGCPLPHGKVAPLRDDVHHSHEAEADEDTGQDAGDKQLPGGHSRQDGEDHQGEARGDDGPDGGCRTEQPEREPVRVAGLLHGLVTDGAEARGVRRGHPAHPRHDHVGNHAYVRQTALEPPHELVREAEQAGREPRFVHDSRPHDEQGHAEQNKAIDPAEHPADDDLRVEAGPDAEGHQRNRRKPQPERHRNPRDEEKKQDAQEQQQHDYFVHTSSPFLRPGPAYASALKLLPARS